MDNLVWKTEKRKINDLVPYDKNPRTISKDTIQKLKDSLIKFNLVEIPVIDTDNTIIAGHQRLKVMVLINRGEEEIDVRIPNRKLTVEEFKEYNIRSNANTGDWDWEALQSNDWNTEELKAWGLDVPKTDDEFYEQSAKSPVYEPKTDTKPDFSSLVDTSKSDELIATIEKSDLSKEEKEFLKFAAYRHNVFNYASIAEYYAHSESKTQRLMENSALVVIDFNAAIENGFVQLTDYIAKIAGEDNAE